MVIICSWEGGIKDLTFLAWCTAKLATGFEETGSFLAGLLETG
jgi:hypothetical protein